MFIVKFTFITLTLLVSIACFVAIMIGFVDTNTYTNDIEDTYGMVSN